MSQLEEGGASDKRGPAWNVRCGIVGGWGRLNTACDWPEPLTAPFQHAAKLSDVTVRDDVSIPARQVASSINIYFKPIVFLLRENTPRSDIQEEHSHTAGLLTGIMRNCTSASSSGHPTKSKVET